MRGVTLIDEARQATDADEQSKLLDRARAELDRFVAANPASAAASRGADAAGDVLVEQAKRIWLTRSNNLPAGAAYIEQRRSGGLRRGNFSIRPSRCSRPRPTFYTAAIDKLPKTPDQKAARMWAIRGKICVAGWRR